MLEKNYVGDTFMRQIFGRTYQYLCKRFHRKRWRLKRSIYDAGIASISQRFHDSVSILPFGTAIPRLALNFANLRLNLF